MDEAALAKELSHASQYGGPQRSGVLGRSPLLSTLLRQAGLEASSVELVYLLDRGIERLPAEQQEVAKAAFRRPPYGAEILEDRLSDAARRSATQRTAELRADPARSSATAPVRSLKTMLRRRAEAETQLAKVLITAAARLSAAAPGGPDEPRPVPGDRSEFVADRTLPDGSLMRPGETAEKVWEIRNAGTVPWTGRYLVRIGATASRSAPITPELVRIPNALPGESVRLTVPVEAPPFAGTYEVHWKMADGTGRLYFPDRYWAGVWFTIIVPGPH